MFQQKQPQLRTLQFLAFHLIPLLLTLSFSSASLQCYKCRGENCAEPEAEMEVCTSDTDVCYSRLQKNSHHRQHGEVRGCSNAATKCYLNRNRQQIDELRSETITLEFPRYFCHLCNGEDLCNSGRELRRPRPKQRKIIERHKTIFGHDYDESYYEAENKGPQNMAEEEGYWGYKENSYVFKEDVALPKLKKSTSGVTPLWRAGFWRGYARALVSLFCVWWGFLFR